MGLILKSVAFAQMAMIPSKYTCQGQDISPPLEWSGSPQGTKSFVLICDDPDAPDPAAPKVVWVHWIVYNIPADVHQFKEGEVKGEQGVNGWGKSEYGGPCPPIGKHRYFFKLYALDTLLDLKTPTKEELLKAMEGHVLEQSELIGVYEK